MSDLTSWLRRRWRHRRHIEQPAAWVRLDPIRPERHPHGIVVGLQRQACRVVVQTPFRGGNSLLEARDEAVGGALPTFAKLAGGERAVLLDEAHAQPDDRHRRNEQHEDERQDEPPRGAAPGARCRDRHER